MTPPIETMMAEPAEAALPWRSALTVAVERLAASPRKQRLLQVFVDHWGMDAYIPPDEVEETVRNAIAGLLACSRALQEEKAGGQIEGGTL